MDLSHQPEFQSCFQGKEMGKQSIPTEDVKKSKKNSKKVAKVKGTAIKGLR